jgi:hypothetical protein
VDQKNKAVYDLAKFEVSHAFSTLPLTPLTMISLYKTALVKATKSIVSGTINAFAAL